MKDLVLIFISVTFTVLLFQNCSKMSSNYNASSSGIKGLNTCDSQLLINYPACNVCINGSKNPPSCIDTTPQVCPNLNHGHFPACKTCLNGSINFPSCAPNGGEKVQATNFIFNHTPVQLPDLNAAICNNIFNKIDIDRNFKVKFFTSAKGKPYQRDVYLWLSDDNQIYAINKNDNERHLNGEFVAEVSKDSDLPNPIDANYIPCLARKDPRQGYKTSDDKQLIAQSLPRVGSLLTYFEDGKLMAPQGGPVFVAQCKNNTKYIGAYTKYSDPGCPASICNLSDHPDDTTEVKIKFLNPELIKNYSTFWPSEQLLGFGLSSLNLQIYKQLGLWAGKSHPCPNEQ